MKIEIWSDVMCPFCYIGKRHFEQAMGDLPFANEIEVEWKSFQLNPEYHNTVHEDLYSYLARAKQMSVEQAKQMTGQVVAMAKNAGIELNFDRNIPANSFKAHQLTHLAKSKNLQDKAEEELFHSHFIEGKDIAQKETLISIGEKIGLTKAEINDVFENDTFAEQVRYDVYESQQLGIRGVPYFVFNRKYAISGAQPVETFKAALVQSYEDWKASRPESNLTQFDAGGEHSCGPAGCEI